MKVTETKEIVALKSEVSELEIQANELNIATAEQNAHAVEFKAKLSKTKKDIEARKKEITDPLNTAIRSARALFAPIEDAFEKAERAVATKLLDYKRKTEEEARKKEAQIAARVERGTIKIETAERKMEQIQRVETHADTAYGRVQFRKVKQIRITDKNLVPDEYWVIDEVALRKAVITDGKTVPGVEMYIEERV